MLLAVIAGFAIGCASRSSNAPPSEFTASDAALFDDAVDLAESPVIADDVWGPFAHRVGRADLIAVIRVESLSSDLVRRRSAYRIAVRIEERLKGDHATDLILRVEDQQPGYRTVQANEERLLRDPFIAFIKWETETGSSEAPVSRWHLSPASEEARQQVERLLREPVRNGSSEGSTGGR